MTAPTATTPTTATTPSARRSRAARLPRIDLLSDPATLAAIVGPVERVSVLPFEVDHRSDATLSRISAIGQDGRRHELILKRSRPADNWEARRTGDTVGREAAVLTEPLLAEVWEVFDCPYRAIAVQDGETGLLMEDIGPRLLPAEGRIGESDEDAILRQLAALHARFWAAPALRLPWLNTPARMLAVLGPHSPEAAAQGQVAPPLFQWVRSGWDAALARLPRSVADLLIRPAEALAGPYAELPWTLLHGDARVRHFAPWPDGRVSAIDWEWLGAGPPTAEVGWYLTINARQRARSPDAVLDRYRAFLEAARGSTFSGEAWERLVDVAVLTGAAMLLWDRALDLEDGAPGAAAEWTWWVDQLQSRWC
jgi:hypothetical protein